MKNKEEQMPSGHENAQPHTSESISADETEHTEATNPAHQDNSSFSEEMDAHPETQPFSDTEQNTPTEEQVRIQLLEEQLDRAKDQMVRALADAENTRKRARKEREDASKYAVSSFARDLLNVADNLRRALEAVPQDIINDFPQIKNISDGIEATERELLSSFEKNGISKIEPLNQKFDPNFHEVMFEAPTPGKEPGTIIQVIEPGYVINERILRPARVGIAAAGHHGGNTENPPDTGHTIDTEA